MNPNKLKNLIIIGASAFGRETFVWASQSSENNSSWRIKGFLDDNKKALSGYDYPIKIISNVNKYQPAKNDLFICPIGDPKIKKKLTLPILRKGGKFTNIIHPTAVIGRNVKIGYGIILCPYAAISSDTVLENFVSVNLHANIGHDVRIGSWTNINPSCSINGRVTVEESVYIGSGATILPDSYIAKEAVIAAGSMVIGNVKPKVTMIGIPAKRLNFPKKSFN